MCDAYAAAHKNRFRFTGLRIGERGNRRCDERDTRAEREVGSEARTVDTVWNDEMRLRRVVVRSIEIDDDALRTGRVTKFDG